MPRARSSGRRSVSTPVSARISAVLPWSMWPAVPSVSGAAVTEAQPRAATAHAGSSSASPSVRGSSSTRPSWIRAITGGSAARSACASAPGSRVAAPRPGPRARAAAARRRRPWPTARTISARARRSRPRARAARAPSVSSEASSIASTGISRRARAGSRYSRRVASSAASESLSIRSARASGCLRAAATASRRPTSSPACGPPSSLSPEQQTSAAPALRPSASIGGSSPSDGHRAGVGQHAGADVVDHRHAEPAQRLDRARPRRTRSCGSSTGARAGSRRRRRWRRRARARSPRAACGWSCRPRPAVAPDCAITSGIRKPPPISTSCPRETTTPRPGPASAAAASRTAAAPLLTDDRGLGAGQLATAAPRRARGGCRARRVSRSSSRLL